MDYFSLVKSHPDIFKNDNAPIRILFGDKDIESFRKDRGRVLAEKSCPLEWAEIGVVLDDPYVIALRDLVEFPNGYRNGYLRILNRAYLEGGIAGVVILPVKDGKILVMRHFRHATRSWHWEIPRGFGEVGISADQNAKNEIEEEVGGVVAELISLGVLHNNTGLEGHELKLFLARLVSVGHPELNEGIQSFRWVSVPELEGMIASGEITDGFTIAAYVRAKLNGLL